MNENTVVTQTINIYVLVMGDNDQKTAWERNTYLNESTDEFFILRFISNHDTSKRNVE